jgi:hypothetical protein
MGVPIQQVLANHFYLEDHPFSPHIDRQNNFDFWEKKAFLTKPLDVFGVDGLERYFSRVGTFGSEIARVTAFLDGLGIIDQGLPPAILIQGAKGSGSNSMASYVAYLIRERCRAEPTLLSIPDIQSENPAKLLQQARRMVDIHIKKHQIAGCEPIMEAFRDEFRDKTPDEGDLSALFANLVPYLGTAPLLVLIVEAISWTRLDWIRLLHKALGPLNVALIFLTEDLKVSIQFGELIRRDDIAPGHIVHLAGLDCNEGRALVEERMNRFRQVGCPSEKAGLFPYEWAAFEKVFQGYPQKRVVIKKLIEYCHRALNKKLSELSQGNVAAPPSLFITWNDFTTALTEAIQAGSVRSS